MKIHLPPELSEYERNLRLMLDMMVGKLHINRHKNLRWTTLQALLKLLKQEIEELETACEEGSQFDIALESCDTANLAVLMGIYALQMPKDKFVAERRNKGKSE